MQVLLYNICLNYITENNTTNIITFYVVTMQSKSSGKLYPLRLIHAKRSSK
jgi:hypothetical protein